ncbi:sigma-70 family RNA polymerase sigma factor [Variovorax sp. J22R115]|uniref:sigma-70 family RNA polymerase sigma factor n=1 Tax=Variovorax sp. J22R115 TaxID=3053509 RepID=UPI0025787865|nr:sigma-70 family RNA polymerase sigma factor [Variovorax sp. J22R115]MDM0049105.1 sigma-70 family RNA polymerase sigma factor [Variovorax sp. J22R115]
MPAPTAIPSFDGTSPDDELMLAYAGGEASAFDALYARNECALYRFVRRLLGVRFSGEVDEVFQEIWMRVSTGRDSFTPQSSPWRIWAFTIAHNLAMDRLRLSGREVAFYAHDEDGDGLEAAQLFSRGLLSDDGGAANDPAHPSEEELAFWRAAGRRLLACLDELPNEQRAAFLLHHEDGFTVETLTGTLDVGAETVRKRLRPGLKKLRSCMERYLSILEQGIGPSEDSEDDLRDARLWQALEYAPDQNTAPDWRIRKAILKRASDAVGAADPDEAEAELELAARPWWRIGPAGGKRSRMPWAAALVTLVIATLVALLWQGEPVVAPQPDSPQVPATTPQAGGASTSQRPSLPESGLPRDSSPASSASTMPFASSEPQAPPAPEPKPPVTSVAPSPPPSAKAQKPPQAIAPPPPSRRESADAAKSAQPVVPATPSASVSPRLTPQESPSARSSMGDDASLALRSDNAARPSAPAAPAGGAPSVARAAPPPSVRTEATDPPTFAALSQWSRITITRRGGETRTLQRAEARDLNALLGSAAISAVRAQPLSGTPEYRITLERDREVLAVFEVAPAQVRWREGKTPSATGVPSAPALAALRDALRDAVQAPLANPVPAAAAPPQNP